MAETDPYIKAAMALGLYNRAPNKVRDEQQNEYLAAKNALFKPAAPQLPSGDPEMPRTITSAYKVLAATVLAAPRFDLLGRPTPSIADASQQKILNRIDKWAMKQYERGILTEPPVPTLIPTTQNIALHVQTIVDEFNRISTSNSVTPQTLDAEIDRDARLYVDKLLIGERDRDNGGKPTEEEERIAKDLSMQAGDKPARTILQNLQTIVYGRAADIVAAQKIGGRAEQQQRFNGMLRNLFALPPNRWFAADWLTTEVMLTPEEQKNLENTTWTITPSRLIVRSINPKSTKDQMIIPLGEIGKTFAVWDGTPRYIDALRIAGTRISQPLLTPLLQQSEIGGLTTIGSPQRSQDLARFAVRNGKAVAEMIMYLAEINRQFSAAAEMNTIALRDPDASFRPPIRPNIITRLLPDPIILESNVRRTPQGNIDWYQLEQQLAEERNRADFLLKATAARLAAENQLRNVLDEKGDPIRLGDRHALKRRNQEVRDLERRIQRSRELQRDIPQKTDTPITCPNCGGTSTSSSMSCSYCGRGWN